MLLEVSRGMLADEDDITWFDMSGFAFKYSLLLL
jgi:hypothetical protein